MQQIFNILKLSLKHMRFLLCVLVFVIQLVKSLCNLQHGFPFSLWHKVQHEG